MNGFLQLGRGIAGPDDAPAQVLRLGAPAAPPKVVPSSEAGRVQPAAALGCTEPGTKVPVSDSFIWLSPTQQSVEWSAQNDPGSFTPSPLIVAIDAAQAEGDASAFAVFDGASWTIDHIPAAADAFAIGPGCQGRFGNIIITNISRTPQLVDHHAILREVADGGLKYRDGILVSLVDAAEISNLVTPNRECPCGHPGCPVNGRQWTAAEIARFRTAIRPSAAVPFTAKELLEMGDEEFDRVGRDRRPAITFTQINDFITAHKPGAPNRKTKAKTDAPR